MLPFSPMFRMITQTTAISKDLVSLRLNKTLHFY